MVRRCSHIGRNHAATDAWFSRLARVSWWVRLAGAITASLALMGSSTAFAAPMWSAPDPIDPAIVASSVSCSSTSFCVAVGFTSGFGSAAVYSDGTWGEASLIDPESQLLSVSCTSSSFCMALAGSGDASHIQRQHMGRPDPDRSGSNWGVVQFSFVLRCGRRLRRSCDLRRQYVERAQRRGCQWPGIGVVCV
jgi:hypothetical protein